LTAVGGEGKAAEYSRKEGIMGFRSPISCTCKAQQFHTQEIHRDRRKSGRKQSVPHETQLQAE